MNRVSTIVLIGFVKLTHSPSCLIIGLMVFLPLVFSGVSTGKAVILALPFALIAMFGFALNDLFDLKKDRINKPYRPLPSQLITQKQAVIICVVLLVAAVSAITLAILQQAPPALYWAALLGIILYNSIVRYAAWLKTLMTALIAATPVAFDMVYLQVFDKNILLAIAILLFIIARELLMDVMDMQGDSLSQSRTLPLLIGATRSIWLSLTIMTSSLVMLFIHALINDKYWIFLSVAFCSCACLFAWFKWRKDHAIKLMWIPMVLGIALITR